MRSEHQIVEQNKMQWLAAEKKKNSKNEGTN